MAFLQFIHLAFLSIWMGSLIFFSFIAAPAIFKVLPRETAGDVVAKIFPKYYQLGCLCGVFTLGSLALQSLQAESWHTARMISLGLMTAMTFYSAFVIGPRVRQEKIALHACKDTPAHAEKSLRFRRLHGFSMVLNLLVVFVGFILLFLTARAFQAS